MDRPNPERRRRKRPPKPLDRATMRDLALSYVARFATSSGKMRSYLDRKLRERGWSGEGPPDPEALVADFVALGYVDDAGWARGRAASLAARGYGGRRIGETLRVAGIDEELRRENEPAERSARAAAVQLARRRKLGPFGAKAPSEDAHRQREKQLAAMVRAGHDFAHARHVVEASSEGDLVEWIGEAEEEAE